MTGNQKARRHSKYEEVTRKQPILLKTRRQMARELLRVFPEITLIFDETLIRVTYHACNANCQAH
jgi:hypothetical protein